MQGCRSSVLPPTTREMERRERASYVIETWNTVIQIVAFKFQARHVFPRRAPADG